MTPLATYLLAAGTLCAGLVIAALLAVIVVLIRRDGGPREPRPWHERDTVEVPLVRPERLERREHLRRMARASIDETVAAGDARLAAHLPPGPVSGDQLAIDRRFDAITEQWTPEGR